MKFILTFIFTLFFSTIATAQTKSPNLERGMFGILKGLKLSEINVSSRLKDSIYNLKDLPNPDPDLFTYRMRYHESTGVCMVVGFSLIIEAMGEGLILRREFDRIRSKYDQIYGPSLLSDYIINGSSQLWSKHFASKLYREEALLAARWFHENDNETGEDIGMLTLSVKSVNSVNAVLFVEARFNNYPQCIKRIYEERNRKTPKE
jgi:hypothetical protein